MSQPGVPARPDGDAFAREGARVIATDAIPTPSPPPAIAGRYSGSAAMAMISTLADAVRHVLTTR